MNLVRVRELCYLLLQQLDDYVVFNLLTSKDSEPSSNQTDGLNEIIIRIQTFVDLFVHFFGQRKDLRQKTCIEYNDKNK